MNTQTSPTEISKTLRNIFGFDSFRPNQESLVKGILAKRDVFGIMPTGGGKSLCYQLPALLLDGCCLVVSPLIALMKDQVDAANALGIPSAYVNSTLSQLEIDAIESDYKQGKLKLLYVAPERLNTPQFIDFIRQSPQNRPSFFAIDEAHCISEWGHDFRPDYMALSRLKAQFPSTPIAAFTATATPQVALDIEEQLRLDEPLKIKASFNRVNLRYEIKSRRNFHAQLLDFLKGKPGSGVIYRLSRKNVEETVSFLQANGIDAQGYHAGMAADVRAKAQESFIRDDCRIMVATVAFGMGIDKADVRFVIHGDLPKNIEGYYQETGRAGRDGDPAECVLYYSSSDIAKMSYFLDQIHDEQEKERTRQLMQSMDRYAAVPQCRRKALLEYFHEPFPSENCGACDYCSGKYTEVDATRDAQIALSAVVRTHGKYGAVHVCDIIVGANTAKIRQFEHNKIKTYGVGKDKNKQHWRQIIDALLAAGYLELSDAQYPVPQINPKGWELMIGEGKFSIQQDLAETKDLAKYSVAEAEEDYDAGLFDHLRGLRKEIADINDVPPYVIFSDRTLREMSAQLPANLDELGQLYGIGRQKLDNYGDHFCKAIQGYRTLHPDLKPSVELNKKKNKSSLKPKVNKGLTTTFLTTLELVQQGLNIAEIATKRGIGQSTVEGHIATLIEHNQAIDVSLFLSTEEEQLARQLFEQHGVDTLKSIVENSDGKIDYGKAKIVRALLTQGVDS